MHSALSYFGVKPVRAYSPWADDSREFTAPPSLLVALEFATASADFINVGAVETLQ